MQLLRQLLDGPFDSDLGSWVMDDNISNPETKCVNMVLKRETHAAMWALP